jgi:L-threonylcarbamoyladenylate synthase
MVRVLDCKDDLKEVTSYVTRGGLIVYPTDTVYGLGCDPHSSSGLKRCFEVKERSDEKLLPVLFSDMKIVSSFVDFGPISTMLAKRFWPGKLTMVLPLRRELDLPYELTRGGKSLAVRVPGSDCALRVLNASGGCLIGTSANISGTFPTSDPNDPKLMDFAQRCDVFIKGTFERGSNIPSTVIQIGEGEKCYTVIREGAVSTWSIEDYLKLRRADDS